MMMPMVPSPGSWARSNTTDLAKFGSSMAGAATSSAPAAGRMLA